MDPFSNINEEEDDQIGDSTIEIVNKDEIKSEIKVEEFFIDDSSTSNEIKTEPSELMDDCSTVKEIKSEKYEFMEESVTVSKIKNEDCEIIDLPFESNVIETITIKTTDIQDNTVTLENEIKIWDKYIAKFQLRTESHPTRKFICVRCPFAFNKSSDLVDHINKKHPNVGGQCPYCKIIPKSATDFASHLWTHEITCDICGNQDFLTVPLLSYRVCSTCKNKKTENELKAILSRKIRLKSPSKLISQKKQVEAKTLKKPAVLMSTRGFRTCDICKRNQFPTLKMLQNEVCSECQVGPDNNCRGEIEQVFLVEENPIVEDDIEDIIQAEKIIKKPKLNEEEDLPLVSNDEIVHMIPKSNLNNIRKSNIAGNPVNIVQTPVHHPIRLYTPFPQRPIISRKTFKCQLCSYTTKEVIYYFKHLDDIHTIHIPQDYHQTITNEQINDIIYKDSVSGQASKKVPSKTAPRALLNMNKSPTNSDPNFGQFPTPIEMRNFSDIHPQNVDLNRVQNPVQRPTGVGTQNPQNFISQSFNVNQGLQNQNINVNTPEEMRNYSNIQPPNVNINRVQNPTGVGIQNTPIPQSFNVNKGLQNQNISGGPQNSNMNFVQHSSMIGIQNNPNMVPQHGMYPPNFNIGLNQQPTIINMPQNQTMFYSMPNGMPSTSFPQFSTPLNNQSNLSSETITNQQNTYFNNMHQQAFENNRGMTFQQVPNQTKVIPNQSYTGPVINANNSQQYDSLPMATNSGNANSNNSGNTVNPTNITNTRNTKTHKNMAARNTSDTRNINNDQDVYITGVGPPINVLNPAHKIQMVKNSKKTNTTYNKSLAGSSKSANPSKPQNKQLLRCPTCSFKTHDDKSLRQHVTHEKTFFCHKLCSFATKELSELFKHAREVHNSELPKEKVTRSGLSYVCRKLCSFNTKEWKELFEHIKKHHKQRLLPREGITRCKHCCFSIISSKALDDHIRLVHNIMHSKNIESIKYHSPLSNDKNAVIELYDSVLIIDDDEEPSTSKNVATTSKNKDTSDFDLVAKGLYVQNSDTAKKSKETPEKNDEVIAFVDVDSDSQECTMVLKETNKTVLLFSNEKNKTIILDDGMISKENDKTIVLDDDTITLDDDPEQTIVEKVDTEKNKGVDSNTNRETIRYTCHYHSCTFTACRGTENYAKSYATHLSIDHAFDKPKNIQYHCLCCQKYTTKVKEYFVDHLLTAHTKKESDLHYCTFCDFKTKNKATLDRHTWDHQNNDACDICGSSDYLTLKFLTYKVCTGCKQEQSEAELKAILARKKKIEIEPSEQHLSNISDFIIT